MTEQKFVCCMFKYVNIYIIVNIHHVSAWCFAGDRLAGIPPFPFSFWGHPLPGQCFGLTSPPSMEPTKVQSEGGLNVTLTIRLLMHGKVSRQIFETGCGKKRKTRGWLVSSLELFMTFLRNLGLVWINHLLNKSRLIIRFQFSSIIFERVTYTHHGHFHSVWKQLYNLMPLWNLTLWGRVHRRRCSAGLK